MGKSSVKERLWDILNAITIIQGLMKDKTIFDYKENNELRWAVERGLEIISEASRHIPESIRLKSESTQWRHIADLGNVLRHEYHRVDDEIIFIIAVDDLPKLESFLRVEFENL